MHRAHTRLNHNWMWFVLGLTVLQLINGEEPIQTIPSFLEKEEHKREYQTTLRAERFCGRKKGVTDFFNFITRLETEHFGGLFSVEYDKDLKGVLMHHQRLFDTPDRRLKEQKIKMRHRHNLKIENSTVWDTKESDFTAKRYFLDPQLASIWRWKVGELLQGQKVRPKLELDFFSFATIYGVSSTVTNVDLTVQNFTKIADLAKIWPNLPQVAPRIAMDAEVIPYHNGYYWEIPHTLKLRNPKSVYATVHSNPTSTKAPEEPPVELKGVLSLMYDNRDDLLKDDASPFQAQWEFRLKETYTSEEKFLWLSQLVWDIFDEVNMYTEWTVPTFTRRDAKSSECLSHIEDFEVPNTTYILDLEQQLHDIEQNFNAYVPPDKAFTHKEEHVVDNDEDEPAEEDAIESAVA